MSVLLLNASPKNNGATQEIIKIIQSQLPSNTVSEIVCLGDLTINYCVGDKSCYETCTCILNDDMASLLKKMNDADTLVIAAPSYWADVPGQFKVFIDRCTAYSNTNPNLAHKKFKSGKKCYAIALRAGTRPIECEHIIQTIEHWCDHMEIAMAGSMYFCSINNKNDIDNLKDSILEKSREWFK
ncbi:MAG TPA: flavodoxin family protein [Clostridiales bacterium]|nr:flavodoxin family protein [Clostridiales bacterium]